MNYLFLDIECSNGNDICSIGYVLTDEKFFVLEQKDILINPESRFVLTNKSGTQGISLAYNPDEFYAAPVFSYYYEDMKKLLEDSNNTVIGFAVSNDAGFIKRACARYKLKCIDFKFFDVQRLDAVLHCDGKIRGLQKILEAYSIQQDDENILHKSDDDAFFTREILLKMLEETGLSFIELAAKNQWCAGEINDGSIFYDGQSISGADKMRKKDYIVFRKFCEKLKKDFTGAGGALCGRKICFERSFESKNYRKMLVLAHIIYSSGGKITSAGSCNTYVYSGKENSRTEQLRERGVMLVLFDEFAALAGYDKDFLEKKAETVDILPFKKEADNIS